VAGCGAWPQQDEITSNNLRGPTSALELDKSTRDSERQERCDVEQQEKDAGKAEDYRTYFFARFLRVIVRAIKQPRNQPFRDKVVATMRTSRT